MLGKETTNNELRQKFLEIFNKELDKLSSMICDYIRLLIRSNCDSVKITTDESGIKDIVVQLEDPSDFEMEFANFIKDMKDLKFTGLSGFAKDFLRDKYNDLLSQKLRENYNILFLKVKLDDSNKLTVTYSML